MTNPHLPTEENMERSMPGRASRISRLYKYILIRCNTNLANADLIDLSGVAGGNIYSLGPASLEVWTNVVPETNNPIYPYRPYNGGTSWDCDPSGVTPFPSDDVFNLGYVRFKASGSIVVYCLG